jgi:hypothetical protein
LAFCGMGRAGLTMAAAVAIGFGDNLDDDFQKYVVKGLTMGAVKG